MPMTRTRKDAFRTGKSSHQKADMSGWGIKNGTREFPNDCADSKGNNRKAASAMIAKIPLPLSRHIAAVYRAPLDKLV
jgi:hypothetical protein